MGLVESVFGHKRRLTSQVPVGAVYTQLLLTSTGSWQSESDGGHFEGGGKKKERKNKAKQNKWQLKSCREEPKSQINLRTEYVARCHCCTPRTPIQQVEAKPE